MCSVGVWMRSHYSPRRDLRGTLDVIVFVDLVFVYTSVLVVYVLFVMHSPPGILQLTAVFSANEDLYEQMDVWKDREWRFSLVESAVFNMDTMTRRTILSHSAASQCKPR